MLILCVHLDTRVSQKEANNLHVAAGAGKGKGGTAPRCGHVWIYFWVPQQQ